MTYGTHGSTPFPPPARVRGRGLAWCGGALLVLAVVGGALLVVLGVSTMSGTLDSFQRVPAGSGDSVTISETGDHKVFHEAPGVSDGVSELAASGIRVTGPDGRVQPLRRAGATETYSISGQEGRWIGTFTATAPGVHRIEPVVERAPGELAVGQGSVASSVLSLLAGIFGGVLVGLTGLVLLIVGLALRASSRRTPAGRGPVTGGR